MRSVHRSDLEVGKKLIPSDNLDESHKNYDPEDWIIVKVEDEKVYYLGGGYDTVEAALMFRKI